MRRPAFVLTALLTLPGCGTLAVDELPPPAGPAPSPALRAAPAGVVVAGGGDRLPRREGTVAPAGGGRRAVLLPRERVLELRSGRRVSRAGAGIGPTHVVAFGGRLFVTDTGGGALLVFEERPDLRLVNRVYLPGGPYAIAVDAGARRLWVTLTARNEIVELSAHGRPRVLRRRRTVRQPDAVAVAAGRVLVAGRAGALQILTP
jgi:hypothetical protein